MLTPFLLLGTTMVVTRMIHRYRQVNAHIDRHRDTL
jgi:hypothetical protein